MKSPGHKECACVLGSGLLDIQAVCVNAACDEQRIRPAAVLGGPQCLDKSSSGSVGSPDSGAAYSLPAMLLIRMRLRLLDTCVPHAWVIFIYVLAKCIHSASNLKALLLP